MSGWMGALGGMGEAGMLIGMQNQKDWAAQDLVREREAAETARQQSLMRLKVELADQQRTKSAGEIDAKAGALIGTRMAGSQVADASTWTPEQESARKAGMEQMKTDVRGEAAASLGYMDEAKTLQDIAASKASERYNTRSLDITEQTRADTKAYHEQTANDTKEYRDEQMKLEREKIAETIKHNNAVLARDKDRLTPAMEYQMKGAAHALDLSAKEVAAARKAITEIDPIKDMDGKKLKELTAQLAVTQKSAEDAKTVYNLTMKSVFGDKVQLIELPKEPEKPPPARNGWDSKTGEVFKGGSVVGTAKSESEARKMFTDPPKAAKESDKKTELIGEKPSKVAEKDSTPSAPVRSTDGGSTWTLDAPKTMRNPAVPYYQEIANPLAKLSGQTFKSRAEAEAAWNETYKLINGR